MFLSKLRSCSLLGFLMLLTSAGAQCKISAAFKLKANEATVINLLPGGSLIQGSVSDLVDTDGAVVLICVTRKDGSPNPIADAHIDSLGRFVSKRLTITLAPEDRVQVQLQQTDAAGAIEYGPPSIVMTVAYKCSSSTLTTLPQPTLELVTEAENDIRAKTSLTSINKQPIDRVLLCDKNDIAVATLTTEGTDPGKARDYTAKHLKLAAKDSFYVEAIGTKETIHIASKPYSLAAFNDATGLKVAMVVGLEIGGYSSQAQNANAFVQLFMESPEKTYEFRHLNSHISGGAWGRIRLLGVASPSTSGIGSTFTDPSGSITKQDFSSIGQALDYAAGGQLFLGRPSPTFGRLGIIVGGGATTPFNSSQTSLTFKAPALSTTECAALSDRFQLAKAGYLNGKSFVDPTTVKASPQCLLSKDGTTAIKDIAFANQDRSNFLGKWGFGLRLAGTQDCSKGRTQCADALGVIDLTIGQDAALTRGQMRNYVLKVDGLLPIKTGEAAYFYLFGSAYTRLVQNQDQDPLILLAETNKPTLPDPSVIVLPFKQPDRDYYRLGLGINLQQVFCKLSSTLCETK